MSIHKKLVLFTVAVVTMSGLLHTGMMVVRLRELSTRELADFRRQARNHAKERLRDRVESIIAVLKSSYGAAHRQELDSALVIKNLTRQMIHLADSLRYDPDAGYIWINNMDVPFPRMVVHPTMPELNGEILDDPTFNCALGEETNLFVAVREACEGSGEGFVDYLWPKPSGDTLIPHADKLSFVKLFAPMGWIVGSGIYMDDLQRSVEARIRSMNTEIRRTIKREIFHSALILTMSLIAVFALSGMITQPIKKLARFARDIARDESNLDHEMKDTGRDEVGVLAKSFNHMVRRIRSTLEGLQAANQQLAASQQALVESESKYRGIFESFLDVYFRTDADGRVVLLSPSVEQVMGYTQEELIGESILEIYMDPNARDALMVELGKSGTSHDRQVKLKRKNNSILWASITSRMVYDCHRSPSGIEGVIRDVTERVESTERERIRDEHLRQVDKLKSLGTLVSGVAHEINNPLNYIGLATDNMELAWSGLKDKIHEIQGDLAKSTKKGIDTFPKFMATINDGVNRIGAIVSELRSFAAADEGKLNTVVNVNAAIESALVIIANPIKKQTRHFHKELASDLPLIKGNAVQVEQVVVNVVSNALQALPNPDCGISIVTRRDDYRRRAVIEVADEGSGIEEKALDRLCEPFYTSKRSKGGTGLGLFITFGIVHAHGGEIIFESVPQKGTVVKIEFPFITGNPDNTQAMENET